MKVVLVMVSSVNGKITRGNESDVTGWTSKEDQAFFSSMVKKHRVLVMGSNTYEAARTKIKLKKNKLRIVLTRDPKKYEAQQLKGQLEFTDETPLELVKRLEYQGYKQLLLTGGSQINSLFLKAGLIDEFYLTIEPYIFGQGLPLVAESQFKTKMKLDTIKKLNPHGSLLLKYKITET